MANREQRRNGKKLLNKPELKQYVDKFCMDVSTMILNDFEKARDEANQNGSKMDFSKLQVQLESAMNNKGEELAFKVKDIMKQNQPQQPQRKMPNVKYSTYSS